MKSAMIARAFLSRLMPKLAAVVVMSFVLLPGLLVTSAGGQAVEPIVPYLSPGYRYLVVPQGEGPAGFEQPGFDDSQFANGDAAFGLGAQEFFGCPLDDTAETFWPLDTDILLRKTFSLPADASNVEIGVAIDNDIQVFINGTDISGGLQQSDFCAVRDRFVFPVPNNLLNFGETNLLAVRASDRGGDSYVDVEVRATLTPPSADLAVTLTDTPDPVRRGEQLTYTATVSNGGPDDAQDVALTLSLTGSAALVAIQGEGVDPDTDCTITYKGSSTFPLLASLTCNLGDVPSDAERTLVVTVQPTKAETLTATASVEATSPDDPGSDNNRATATTTVTRGR